MDTEGEGLVLITGAAGGIGRACAAAFAGKPRLLVDRDAPALAEMTGPDDVVVAGDLSRSETIDQLIDRLAAAGGLAAGIHTVAISPTMGEAAAILALNYVATVRLTERLLAVAKPGACLVLIASLAGHRPQRPDRVARLDEALDQDGLRALADGMDPTAAYALSKHGVIRLAEQAAAAWGGRKVRIVSLSPGLIDTPMQSAEAGASDAIERLMGDRADPQAGPAYRNRCRGGVPLFTGRQFHYRDGSEGGWRRGRGVAPDGRLSRLARAPAIDGRRRMGYGEENGWSTRFVPMPTWRLPTCCSTA